MRTGMIWVTVLVLTAVLVVAVPGLAERRRLPIDEEARSSAPGQFANLPMGATHYQWHGPKDGQVAVCVHGLTTPSYVFAAIVMVLTRMGFRVLTYDLYGRGYSARPQGPQTRAFFLDQLRALLEHEEVGDELVIVGYSMGGRIAAAFAAEEGHRVDRLILLASAGLLRSPPGLLERLMRVPLIGDWITLTLGGIILRRGLRAIGETSEIVPGIIDLQAAETRRRGYLPAVLSSQRHLLLDDMADDLRSLADNMIAVLAIWGEKDPLFPPSCVGMLAEFNPAAHQVVVPDAGHGLLYTHPNAVMTAVQGFLRRV